MSSDPTGTANATVSENQAPCAEDARHAFYEGSDWKGMRSAFASPAFSYKSYFDQANVLAALQMMPDEIPWLTQVPAEPEPRDTVLFLGCNALKTPHLILSVVDTLNAMGVDFVTLGGPANCCGIVHHLGEDYDVSEKLSDSSTAKIARFRPHNVVTICPNCNYQYENVVSKTTEVPFEMVQFYEFLHARLADLPIRGNFAKRIGLHRHAGSSHHQDRHGEVCTDILRAIPGVEVVDLPQYRELGAYCTARAMTNATPDRHAEIIDELFAAATGAACDIVATLYHSCQRELCGEEHRRGVEVKSVYTIVGDALGFPHEDKLKRFKEIGDVEHVLEVVAPNLAAHHLPPEAARAALASVLG